MSTVYRYFQITEYSIEPALDTITIVLTEVDEYGYYLDLSFGITYKYKDYVKWDAEDLHKELEKDIDKYLKDLDKEKKDKEDKKQAEIDNEWLIGQTVTFEEKPE